MVRTRYLDPVGATGTNAGMCTDTACIGYSRDPTAGAPVWPAGCTEPAEMGLHCISPLRV